MPNYKPKTCAWCGTEFTPNSAPQKYCTPEHCRAADRKRRCQRRRELRKDNGRRTPKYKPKICKYCGTEFTPTTSHTFYCAPEHRKAAQNERWREYNLEYYRANKERYKQLGREWRRNNREAIRKYERKWLEKNRERKRESQRKWRVNNPEANRAMARKSLRKWRANNPDKVGALKALRAKAELEGNATPELIEAKWEASGKTCCLCGEPIDGTLPPRHPMSRTLEHLTPIVRGGRHDIENLDFAHFSCNSSKKDKTLEEYKAWLAQQDPRDERS